MVKRLNSQTWLAYRSVGGPVPNIGICNGQMPPEEEQAFNNLMARDAAEREKILKETAKRLKAADEYEIIQLY